MEVAKCDKCGASMVIVQLPLIKDGYPVFTAYCPNPKCKPNIIGYINFPKRKTEDKEADNGR